MEIGIDSFAAVKQHGIDTPASRVEAISELLERIEKADAVGLDVFGIGEHHRKEFLDSAPAIILAAAASRTKKITLTPGDYDFRASAPGVMPNIGTKTFASNQAYQWEFYIITRRR